MITFRRRGSAARVSSGSPVRAVPDRPDRVLVVTAAVGAGHDGAAHELARRLRARGVEVEVRDWLDALPHWGRLLARDCYLPAVQHLPRFFDWLFHSIEDRPTVRAAVVGFCRLAERDVRRWSRGADLVVSTYPLASQTLGRLRATGAVPAPVVTFVTDPSTHRLWCHAAVDLHLCVTGATAVDGRRYRVPMLATGPLTGPRFARPVPVADRDRTRLALGINGTEPVVLISAGSLGMGQVPETVRAVLAHPRARALVLCGRNDALRTGFAGQDRVIALGWRDDVPELMAAADVLVHNAGGLSFTEALVAGLPAVTYLAIPGHGTANAEVLAAAGLAPMPDGPAELAAAIEEACAWTFASRRERAHHGERDAAAVVLAMIHRSTSVVDEGGAANGPDRMAR